MANRKRNIWTAKMLDMLHRLYTRTDMKMADIAEAISAASGRHITLRAVYCQTQVNNMPKRNYSLHGAREWGGVRRIDNPVQILIEIKKLPPEPIRIEPSAIRPIDKADLMAGRAKPYRRREQ